MAAPPEAVAASAHHVQDVGKILLQAQSDLRQIRETLSVASGSHSGAVAAESTLQAVVEKVETELRLKAEAVLNTVVHGSASTLPSIGAYNFSSSQPLETAQPPPTYSSLLRRKPMPAPMPRHTRSAEGSRGPGAQRPDAIARPAAAAIADARHQSALRNPNSAMSRAHMSDRFGVMAPRRHEPLRPIGRDKPGKLNKARTSGALGVPSSEVRHDPQAVPPIGPKDVAAGLYSLVTRGLIPPSVDLTPAMARKPAPLVQAPAKVHDFKTQFAAHNSSAYISPFGFNVSNTRLDLLSDVGVTLAEKRLREPVETVMAPKAPPAEPSEPADELEAVSFVGAPVDPSARHFDELMDTFSLHHFIIRHGHTLDTTPEFASFQRKYAADWGAIRQLISILEGLMQTYNVPLAYIDGQKLAALALDPLAAHDAEALLDCLVNSEQVRATMEVPGSRYHAGSDAETIAATELQAAMRGRLARKLGGLLRIRHEAAMGITRQAKVFVTRSWLQRRLAERRAKLAEKWDQLVAAFKVEWPRIKEEPRVIIHIASLSLTQAQRVSIPDLEVRQNGQLPRLCDVRLPNVDVCYVSPFALNEDVSQYFSKVLEIGGVANPEKRYKVVIPENLHKFPRTLSLTSQLLYSPRALKRITNFCRGRRAYIVPSVVGPEERELALTLGFPLLAPAPSAAAALGSKSGNKRIFSAAQVNMPPGLHDLYDEEAMCAGLARLICSHLDVPRWLLKIDDEFGGRGHAHIDLVDQPVYHSLLRAHDSSPHTWEDPHIQSEIQGQLAADLKKVLAENAVINCRWLWRSWREFLAAFRRIGGVIEAAPLHIASSPSVNLCVEPDGAVSVRSAHEQIFSSPFTFVGAAFPQTAVPFAALREAALSIGRTAYERGLIGHMGVDFVSFIDSQGQLRLWAVDLNLRLTHTAVTFSFFDFLVGGAFDSATGRYHTQPEGGPPQPRAYVMNEMLYHKQLGAIHHSAFFNLCRLKGVSFDLQERTGTVFNLMDSFIGGTLGIQTVGTSLLDALRKFADCLDFMQKQVGPATGGKPTALTHETSFRDVIKAIKAIVDVHVGGAQPPPAPAPLPPPLPKEELELQTEDPLVPGISGTAILPKPDKYYLKSGGAEGE